MAKQQPKRNPSNAAGWDALASWYDGWVGAEGSDHHRKLAIPALLDLLDLQHGERLLDIGAGQGVLAPYAARCGAIYTGVEISARLLGIARQRHPQHGRFLQGDARRLGSIEGLKAGSFNAAAFLLSIQDMNPLEDVLRAAAEMLRDGGRLVMLMTHPCFRVPRQSGWGHDPARDLRFRRVDRYLNPIAVPMKAYGDTRRGGKARGAKQRGEKHGESPRSGVSMSFHRPLNHYVNGLAACGLMIDALREITTYQDGANAQESRANAEIPLFLGLRARKV